MAIRIRIAKKRSKRVLQGTGNPRAESVYESQEKHIRNHPRFATILGAMEEGISNADIAEWFAKEGWTTVNERTFLAYLNTFKRRNSAVIKSGDSKAIDGLITAQQPGIDVNAELSRLYRLQKVRIKVDVDNEIAIGKLFNTTHKEVEAARRILETMSEASGGKRGISDKSVNSTDESARDTIREIQKDEAGRDRMNSLTTNLVKVLNDA